MKKSVPEKLAHARAVMKKNKLDALLIPTGDPHGSEYLPAHWALRAYMSDFHGSAGTLLITADTALLWTDSRYWIAAGAALENSGIELMKAGAPDVPKTSEYIARTLKKNAVLGLDGEMFSQRHFADLSAALHDAGIKIKIVPNLCSALWPERPAPKNGKIVEFPVKYAGESRADKLARLLGKMREVHADAMLITSLYDIAWLLNLRSSDTPCTPVFTGYVLVEDTIVHHCYDDGGKKVPLDTPHSIGHITLFADPKRFSVALRDKLKYELALNLQPYEAVRDAVSALNAKKVLIYDPAAVSASLAAAMKCETLTKLPAFAAEMKAIKNVTELDHLHDAMIRDGVAMTEFLCDFEADLQKGALLNECDAADRLDARRRAQKDNKGLSFESIVAFGPNAAMCHYAPERESAAVIKRDGVLLIDSGGQYNLGTTDVTRTFAFGKTAAAYRDDYTLVLKGHLALSRAIFPVGTNGGQLDVLARASLWEKGENFFHGTGHGVGFYLNVHEGPHCISANCSHALLPGMVVTNEPGVYREGKWGVRIENMLAVVPHKTTEFGRFLHFENLTLFPYDRASMNLALLTDSEIAQINAYHKHVLALLSPLLDAPYRAFLTQKCAIIKR